MAEPKEKSKETPNKIRPALTPEAREQQMISLAVDLAERQLLDGSASSQVITHYLKLGSSKDKLEKEKMKKENELMQAKIEALETGKHIEELYADAIKAMRKYRGEEPDD